MEAGIAGDGDGGQEFLQGLQLLAVDGKFGVLCLLEPQVVIETAMDRVVQGKLDYVVSSGMRGDAAIEGIGGGGGTGRLRADGEGAKQRGNNEHPYPSNARLWHSSH